MAELTIKPIASGKLGAPTAQAAPKGAKVAGGPPSGGAPMPVLATGPQPVQFGTMARKPIIFGLVVVFLFFIVLGSWAALAPLVSGATASGIVSPDSSRKVIQHLEGGIIGALHVREGDEVKKGDLLITLEPTRAEATFSSRRGEWLRLLIAQARVSAQSLELDNFVIPVEVTDTPNDQLNAFAAQQRKLFNIRRENLTNLNRIYLSQIEQSRSEIRSIYAENVGLEAQAVLLTRQIEDKQDLLTRQLIQRSEVEQLQYELYGLDARTASNEGAIARVEQKISEIEQTSVQARDEYFDKLTEEGTGLNQQIATIERELEASGDVLRRTEIKSPVDGIVLNLRNQTTGGVVRPGEPILDIVPIDDDLIIVARLKPADIDLVQLGLTAQVQLLPFANRNTLPLAGEVIHVGADSVLDDATGERFYEVRVRVSGEELAAHEGFYLSPGMPADVIIVTGERTMLQYLVQPVARSLRSAFVYD